jgi:hypothetical protein
VLWIWHERPESNLYGPIRYEMRNKTGSDARERQRPWIGNLTKRTSTMIARLIFCALAALLLQAPAVQADDTIRVSTTNGKQRAEFTLNGELACVLENERVVCAPPSK